MGKWIKNNVLNIIQLLPAVGWVVGTVIAWSQGIAWYLIVSFGLIFSLVAIPTTLLTINQIASWKDRHKKTLTQLSDKELENTIRDWVIIPAWGFHTMPLNNDALFIYRIDHQEISVYIQRLRAEPQVIGLSCGLHMVSKKTVLSEQEWISLSGQLSIEMARFGIEYDFVGKPNKWDTIQLVEPVVLDDSMTGFYFRSRVMFVIRAIILVQELWKQALRDSNQQGHGKGDSQS